MENKNIEEIKNLILKEFDERYTVEFSTDYKLQRMWLEEVLFFVLDFDYLVPKDKVQAEKEQYLDEFVKTLELETRMDSACAYCGLKEWECLEDCCRRKIKRKFEQFKEESV